MAKYVSTSIHHASDEKATARGAWHRPELGGAWISVSIGNAQVDFHGTREQLGDLYTVIGQVLQDLDAGAEHPDSGGPAPGGH